MVDFPLLCQITGVYAYEWTISDSFQHPDEVWKVFPFVLFMTFLVFLLVHKSTSWNHPVWHHEIGVSKNRGTPKSSILIGFSLINHPFWGTPIFGNTQMFLGFLGWVAPTFPLQPWPPLIQLNSTGGSIFPSSLRIKVGSKCFLKSQQDGDVCLWRWTQNLRWFFIWNPKIMLMEEILHQLIW